ncbi:MAG: serine/threonine protein kinase [Roseovarius sp.]
MQSNATNLCEFTSDELVSGHALLYGQYTIEHHLIDGGFGMTYLARDSLERRVVIKECFPSTICRRISGEVRPRKPGYQDRFQTVIRSFLREALRMAKLDHPNIVKVHQVFQENNTAYIAMDFVDGMDLLSMLDMDPGRLTESLITDLLADTLSALDYLHDLGMLHRDISPDNILLDANDKLTLIDFGAAREEAARQTRALSTVMSVKDGYSPHEFYYTDGKQRASSDIYSLGATFYHLITGYAPPDCQKRVAALSSGKDDPYRPLLGGNRPFDAGFLAAVDRALCISQDDRFQSAQEWLDALKTPAEVPVEAQAEVVQVEAAPVEDPQVEDANPKALEKYVPQTHQTRGHAVQSKPAPRPTSVEPEIEVELEPELLAAISSLVKDTMKDIKPVDPVARRKAELTQQVVEKKEHALVDIFGQPIDNLDKWLKENDKERLKSKRAAECKTADRVQETDQDDVSCGADRHEGSGSALLRAFSRLTGQKKRTVVAASH